MECNRKVATAIVVGAIFTSSLIVVLTFVNSSPEECDIINDNTTVRIGETGSCESKPIDSSGNLRISVCNKSIVDIRQFVLKDNNEYQATIKGINLRREQWNEMIKLTNWIQCKLN
jgi:hypothetical protein